MMKERSIGKESYIQDHGEGLSFANGKASPHLRLIVIDVSTCRLPSFGYGLN